LDALGDRNLQEVCGDYEAQDGSDQPPVDCLRRAPATLSGKKTQKGKPLHKRLTLCRFAASSQRQLLSLEAGEMNSHEDS
jgi:hypothetical protein